MCMQPGDLATGTRLQDELMQLWQDTKFTVLFVTHSIPEAIRIGSRILLLSPHPGQVKAELNSDGEDRVNPATGEKLSDYIHGMLFADPTAAAELKTVERVHD